MLLEYLYAILVSEVPFNERIRPRHALESQMPHIQYQLSRTTPNVQNPLRFRNLGPANCIDFTIGKETLRDQPTDWVPAMIGVRRPLMSQKNLEPIVLAKRVVI